jgi:hypothetical protein
MRTAVFEQSNGSMPSARLDGEWKGGKTMRRRCDWRRRSPSSNAIVVGTTARGVSGAGILCEISERWLDEEEGGR